MSKRGMKKGHKKIDTEKVLILVTATINLLIAIIELIIHIVD